MHFYGVPDFQKCASILDYLFFCFNLNQQCPFKSEPLLKNYACEFYTFSVFHGVLSNIGALRNSSSVTVRGIGSAAKDFCNKNYKEVRANKYAQNNCMAGVYIHELLTKGYHATEDFTVKVVKKINGLKISWILGSLLYKMNLL